ncbi:CLUMA_CG000291, isoform A [Clunio marinus]|uniref:CLUMA_CG000291, isoform A n=1 Tax=Clunio marinus TaxID=568069 RepID=A0A1J1HID3_9DIPT|nr:CLUMA_CG000291, isoform A [Clunio marinus]
MNPHSHLKALGGNTSQQSCLNKHLKYFAVQSEMRLPSYVLTMNEIKIIEPESKGMEDIDPVITFILKSQTYKLIKKFRNAYLNG